VPGRDDDPVCLERARGGEQALEVEAVVPGLPRGADVAAFEDDDMLTGTLQHRRRGEPSGPRSDDGDHPVVLHDRRHVGQPSAGGASRARRRATELLSERLRRGRERTA
jgi:hypothetical protein